MEILLIYIHLNVYYTWAMAGYYTEGDTLGFLTLAYTPKKQQEWKYKSSNSYSGIWQFSP